MKKHWFLNALGMFAANSILLMTAALVVFTGSMHPGLASVLLGIIVCVIGGLMASSWVEDFLELTNLSFRDFLDAFAGSRMPYILCASAILIIGSSIMQGLCFYAAATTVGIDMVRAAGILVVAMTAPWSIIPLALGDQYEVLQKHFGTVHRHG